MTKIIWKGIVTKSFWEGMVTKIVKGLEGQGTFKWQHNKKI